MKHIGRVIRHYRIKAGLSMLQLSNNICSKDYIFLLEKEKRLPSVDILDKIALRLNFDFKEYIQFLQNPSPVDAKNFINELNNYSEQMNSDKLADLLNYVPDKPWAKTFPVDIEILSYKIGFEVRGIVDKIHHYKNDKDKFLKIIDTYLDLSIDDFNILSVFELHALEKYACLLNFDDMYEEASLLFMKLQETLSSKKHIQEFKLLYIRICLNSIQHFTEMKLYKKAIKMSISLITYQQTNSLFQRLPLSLIILSRIYEKINNKGMARKSIKKAIAISKLLDNSKMIEISKNEIGYKK